MTTTKGTSNLNHLAGQTNARTIIWNIERGDAHCHKWSLTHDDYAKRTFRRCTATLQFEHSFAHLFVLLHFARVISVASAERKPNEKAMIREKRLKSQWIETESLLTTKDKKQNRASCRLHYKSSLNTITQQEARFLVK